MALNFFKALHIIFIPGPTEGATEPRMTNETQNTEDEGGTAANNGSNEMSMSGILGVVGVVIGLLLLITVVLISLVFTLQYFKRHSTEGIPNQASVMYCLALAIHFSALYTHSH